MNISKRGRIINTHREPHSKMIRYCLNLHNSKYIQSNEMLNSKQYTKNIFM